MFNSERAQCWIPRFLKNKMRQQKVGGWAENTSSAPFRRTREEQEMKEPVGWLEIFIGNPAFKHHFTLLINSVAKAAAVVPTTDAGTPPLLEFGYYLYLLCTVERCGGLVRCEVLLLWSVEEVWELMVQSDRSGQASKSCRSHRTRSRDRRTEDRNKTKTQSRESIENRSHGSSTGGEKGQLHLQTVWPSAGRNNVETTKQTVQHQLRALETWHRRQPKENKNKTKWFLFFFLI